MLKLRYKYEVYIPSGCRGSVQSVVEELFRYGLTGVSVYENHNYIVVYFYSNETLYRRFILNFPMERINFSKHSRLMYEVYLPNSAITDKGLVYEYRSEYYRSVIVELVNKLVFSGCRNVSLHGEEGYYNSSSGITYMKNSVITFKRDSEVDVSHIISFVKTKLRQETVLVVKDGEALIC